MGRQEQLLLGGAVAGGVALLLMRPQKRKDGPPLAGSWKPFLGSTLEYLAGPAFFLDDLRKTAGDIFKISVLGMQWTIMFDPSDVKRVCALPEKKGSLIKAYDKLAGSLLPRDPGGHSSPETAALFDDMEVSGVPAIAHAVRFEALKSWVGPLQAHLTDEVFKAMREQGSGEFDLWELSKNMICQITVRAMLGPDAVHAGVLQKWIDIFLEADPTRAAMSPGVAISAILETMLLGERRVFGRARALMLVLVDAATDLVIKHGGAMPGRTDVLASMVASW